MTTTRKKTAARKAKPLARPAKQSAALVVTRAPNAPPRRGGRAWDVGDTDVGAADMTAALRAALDADPGYSVSQVSPA